MITYANSQHNSIPENITLSRDTEVYVHAKSGGFKFRRKISSKQEGGGGVYFIIIIIIITTLSNTKFIQFDHESWSWIIRQHASSWNMWGSYELALRHIKEKYAKSLWTLHTPPPPSPDLTINCLWIHSGFFSSHLKFLMYIMTWHLRF